MQARIKVKIVKVHLVIENVLVPMSNLQGPNFKSISGHVVSESGTRHAE